MHLSAKSKKRLTRDQQKNVTSIATLQDLDTLEIAKQNKLSSIGTHTRLSNQLTRNSISSINNFKLKKGIQCLSTRSLAFKTKSSEDFKLLQSKLSGISAKSLTIARLNPRFEIILSRDQMEKRKIASLTKIMTLHCSLKISKLFKIDLNSTIVTISEKGASINGTSAQLKPGDKLSLYDLLYGMMLPSGNDAAHSLAEYFGKVIIASKLFNCSRNDAVRAFIDYMNQQAKLLKMHNTFYMNPHGLDNKEAYSCSEDVAKLCAVVLKNDLFRSIARTKEYTVSIERDRKPFEINWVNTNKLLAEDENCLGLKTGVTPQAKPCLATYWSFKNSEYLVVVIGCSDKAQRNKESRELAYEMYNLYN